MTQDLGANTETMVAPSYQFLAQLISCALTNHPLGCGCCC